MYLLKDLSYLWMIFFIMIVAGLAKEYALFAPAYAYVKSVFRSNKFVVVLLSAIGGVLPIEGRVTVSAGLLDTVAPKDGEHRAKFGIVDYLATHHYYMWSPLEKTVILPIAAFGLSYWQWLGVIWPLLIASFFFIFVYIWTTIKDEQIAITPMKVNLSNVIRNVFPMVAAIGAYIYGVDHVWCFGTLALYYMFLTQQWAHSKLFTYVNFQVLLVVACVMIFGNFVKAHSAEVETLVRSASTDGSSFKAIAWVSLLSFWASFAMGSSGKFAAIAVMLSQVFGIEYFLWFFAVDFAGYLISPTHKCVAIGNRYFGTPVKTYMAVLTSWGLFITLIAFCVTFVKVSL
jgi:hypothetical protein